MFKTRIVSFTVLFLAFISSALLLGQSSPQDMQKAMDAYMKAGAVTADHEFLKRYVGNWDAKTTMWTFPGQPPTTSQNAYESSFILGGRYLLMKFKGMMMGQPFEGLQIIGYDNLAKKYATFWIDNTSTSFFLTTGTLDPAKKVLTESGQWADPMTGGTSKVKMTTRYVGPDEFIYEQFMFMPDGKEFKSMENHCTRKK
jgi:hypothetical protein